MASATNRVLALTYLWLLQHCIQYASALFPPHSHPVRPDNSFQWSSITPSEDLVYQDCYPYTIHDEESDTLLPADDAEPHESVEVDSHFKCARLLVPLDWQNASNPNKVAIAIIKLPVRTIVDGRKRARSGRISHSRGSLYGGAVVVNPGGPGGSGVQSILLAGHSIQELIDGENSFDIISFDPRGVGFSTPTSHCFDDYLDHAVWELKQRVVGLLDTGPEAIKMQFADAKGRGALCAGAASYSGNGDNIRAYMTTAYTARDMLELVTKNQAVEEDSQSSRGHGIDDAHKQQMPLRSAHSKAQLQYLGFSYGTFLGNTFASMYPEHVGKMLLDGNIDADDYVGKWMKNVLPDFEEGWSTFFERCYEVGQRCALWRHYDTSAGDIRTRVDSILDHVKEKPIPVSSNGSTDLITSSDVKAAIFNSNYVAASSFAKLATFLNAIYTNNVTSPFPPPIGLLPSPISCPSPNASTSWPAGALDRDTSLCIMCSDSDSLTSTPFSDFSSYLSFLESQSRTAGPIVAALKLACLAWPSSSTALKPRWRFTGPFGRTIPSNNKTGTPILFLNNRLDPVCPIRNAHQMAKRYPASVVLEQDAVGHCALTASLGDCVRAHVRRYFNEGVLPPPGTVCPGGCRAFEEDCAGEKDQGIDLWGLRG